MSIYSEQLVQGLREKDGVKSSKCVQSDATINETRQDLQEETRNLIYEVRRAFGYAAQCYVMRERQQYIDWLENATDLLIAAIECRETARKEPWRLRLDKRVASGYIGKTDGKVVSV